VVVLIGVCLLVVEWQLETQIAVVEASWTGAAQARPDRMLRHAGRCVICMLKVGKRAELGWDECGFDGML